MQEQFKDEENKPEHHKFSAEEILGLFLSVYENYRLNGDQLSEFLSQDRVKTVEIDYKGEIIGFGTLEIENNNGYGCITGVVLHKDYRGKGIGRQINDQILQLAQENEIRYIQSDAILNFEGKSSDFEGGNNPNIANLAIAHKNGFLVNGFSLGCFVDVARGLNNQVQNTSLIRLVKPCQGENETFQQEFFDSRSKLVGYLKQRYRLPIQKIYPKDIISEKQTDGDRVTLVETSNIESFIGTSFIPTYFLPSYRTKGQTSYFGVYYKKILTRSPNYQNIFGLPRGGDKGVESILSTDDIQLLDLVEGNILLNYCLKSKIKKSPPKFTELNL